MTLKIWGSKNRKNKTHDKRLNMINSRLFSKYKGIEIEYFVIV